MKTRKRNITITLDEDAARWARVQAALRDMSVSELLASLVREQMVAERSYEVAMRDFLSREPKPLKREGKYPDRSSLHER